MTEPSSDPYETLGIRPEASDADLRSAYRRLVQVHHPDHNHGSAESSRRFEAVQAAYVRIVTERRTLGSATAPAAGGTRAGGPARASRAGDPSAGAPPRSARYNDINVNARVAAMERELYEARLAQERVRQAAHAASDQTTQGPRRATPEELGYVTTDDTVGKILEDAGDAVSKRWSRSRGWSFAERLANLFGEAE